MHQKLRQDQNQIKHILHPASGRRDSRYMASTDKFPRGDSNTDIPLLVLHPFGRVVYLCIDRCKAICRGDRFPKNGHENHHTHRCRFLVWDLSRNKRVASFIGYSLDERLRGALLPILDWPFNMGF